MVIGRGWRWGRWIHRLEGKSGRRGKAFSKSSDE